jgi:hypothetical protein
MRLTSRTVAFLGAVLILSACAGYFGLKEYRAYQRKLLPPPALAQRERGTGHATLRWDPVPQSARDPKATPDPVAGFRVYVGRSPDALGLEAVVADPRASRHDIHDLASGRHYYAVTSVTRLGIESERSPVISKDIP